MNRLLALGVVGWVVFGALGACQGPDPFDRAADAGIHGLGGHGLTGAGGMRGVGGFVAIGVGGRGVGGNIAGVGGNVGGVGGARGTGGMPSDGGIGTGGMPSDGGMGTGGRGVGGRSGDAGANCITTITSNGYAFPPAPACSACIDQNHLSFETKCMMMLDCMAAKAQPCTGGCELDCFNAAGGSGPLQGCVDALLSAAGCP